MTSYEQKCGNESKWSGMNARCDASDVSPVCMTSWSEWRVVMIVPWALIEVWRFKLMEFEGENCSVEKQMLLRCRRTDVSAISYLEDMPWHCNRDVTTTLLEQRNGVLATAHLQVVDLKYLVTLSNAAILLRNAASFDLKTRREKIIGNYEKSQQPQISEITTRVCAVQTLSPKTPQN